VPIAGLAEELSGLRIVHLSDLHLSCRVEPAFFLEVMREVNLLKPDLVLLTGDVFDKVDCLAWIEEILAPLQAADGKFFILGNHDNRLSDVFAARRAIEATGFADLGGKSQTVAIRGKLVCLTGNERPWFTAETLEDLCPVDVSEKPLKILLSHSPDQFGWAHKRAFDLMLCGHTHGGQIQFPFIGPVVCPSWYGVRYAEGLFVESKPVLHVSRGLSGLFPLRFNCRPAVDLLILEGAGG
jgi:predicted MPP superfamily phosphohydrolase